MEGSVGLREPMILLLSMLVVGGVMLYLGAEGLVWGGMRLALRLRVAPLVIGLTVVAFGTSLPEFTVSLYAVMQEAEGIAVGDPRGRYRRRPGYGRCGRRRQPEWSGAEGSLPTTA